ncbi:hypothetical protein IW140_005807 [Coemansia sp. RSA 1813]|nr:hypothetical protein EV178_005846 [Coemansia sp. RSA 1646]KAJ1767842.1 hypothetical protein LPJ74_005144 [Coemansia sp. RSA 1843]KAJ2092113.1 hypothetical protein IW138_001479 [Coemansia sp. RSA 986]KAJ2211034.1 hypothetical protein EV179_005808 [Coemansia sp. RSA 487]KAJ2564281.1 hypothetical protein IW140_005807 [Coemansia sp. RSA 1813]
MITLDSLVSEYGQDVDKHLIAAIWAEQAEDRPKCRNIIHMLSGRGESRSGSISSLVDFSESCSMGSLDSQGGLGAPLSATTTTASSPLSSDVSSQGGVRHLSSSNMAGGSETIEPITSTDALIDFLVACFPECGADYLATKVDEIFTTQDKSAFQVDPVEAIDIISNAFYNDMEAVENQKYHKRTQPTAAKSAQANTSLLIDDIAAKYKISGSGKKSKKKKKSGSNRANNGGFSATTGVDYGSLSQESGNAWNVIDKELDSICSIFPMLSIRIVKSAYHECGANVDKTVEKLADIVSSQPKTKGRNKEPAPKESLFKMAAQERQNAENIIDMLRIAFPDEEEALLQKAVAGSLDADYAAEKLLQIKSKPAAEDDLKPEQPIRAAPKKGTKWHQAPGLSRHRVASAKLGTNEPASQPNTIHDPFERIPLSDLTTDARGWVAEHAVDPDQCRKRAEALILKRNELYAKAAKAYSRRSTMHGHSGTAMYYSIEGHKYDARARVWRMRAAQSAVAMMRQNDANVVDLHGLTCAEAVAIVLEEVNAWYVRTRATADARQLQNVKPLHIVTGKGTHSPDGKAHLHPSVVRALRNNSWWFEESAGYIDVLGVRQGGTRSV